MASSSADWVFAGARLISSASKKFVKIGPRTSRNSCVLRSKMLVPVTSAGIRSGVNWMRWKSPATARASAFTNRVFPMPGTPSMSACPPASSVTSARLIASPWPTITRLNASRTRRAPLVILANASEDSIASPPDCACASNPSTGFWFMRSVPPRKSSFVKCGINTHISTNMSQTFCRCAAFGYEPT